MTLFVSLLAGYMVGTMPTADWLGRLKGVDLRREGSGNPGANNALRLGGPALAAAVLLVEMGKGAGAVLLGAQMAGPAGAIAAGIGATAGNVYNVWYQFDGGKGLGIIAGVLLAAWPTVLLPAVVLIAVAAALTRSSGAAALIAAIGLVVAAVTWVVIDLPMGWGVEDALLVLPLSTLAGALIWPRHWPYARFRERPRLSPRVPGSPDQS